MAEREYYNRRAPDPPIRPPDFIAAAKAAGGWVWHSPPHDHIQLGPIVVIESFYHWPRWRRLRFEDAAQAVAWASRAGYPDPVESSWHATVWEALGLPQPPDADRAGLH